MQAAKARLGKEEKMTKFQIEELLAVASENSPVSNKVSRGSGVTLIVAVTGRSC